MTVAASFICRGAASRALSTAWSCVCAIAPAESASKIRTTMDIRFILTSGEVAVYRPELDLRIFADAHTAISDDGDTESQKIPTEVIVIDSAEMPTTP